VRYEHVSRLRNTIAQLRGQLWLIPGLISLSAAALAYFLLFHRPDLGQESAWWLHSGDAATARGLLSSLLTGLIAMTSLVVSVTFVILTLSANQLGPRLIVVFVADRQIQSVLGLFLGTILYLVLVLRTLDDGSGARTVPHLAVSVGTALTVGCLFALVFYIHKIARSIIADNVVETVSRRLQRDLAQIFSRDDQDIAIPEIKGEHRRALALGSRGYVQVIDYKRLVAIAFRMGALLEVHVRAGDHVLETGDHVVVHADGNVDDESEGAIRRAFTIGGEKTPAQDPEYGLRHLVEIALRALSPGVNDLFTAIAVIERLGEAFEEVLPQSLQQHVYRDGTGEIRLVARQVDAHGLVDSAFDPIRRAAIEHPSVLICCAETLARLSPVLGRDEARRAVLAQVVKLSETARHASLTPIDQNDTLQRIEAAKFAIAVRWEDPERRSAIRSTGFSVSSLPDASGGPHDH
jgi:uncharacterized membrane protein